MRFRSPCATGPAKDAQPCYTSRAAPSNRPAGPGRSLKTPPHPLNFSVRTGPAPAAAPRTQEPPPAQKIRAKGRPMPLMTTKPMFDLAYTGGFAVGAFNVNNMEITQGIIEASAAEKSPLILQTSKGARKYAKMNYLRHIILAAVEEYPDLPIAIHHDN